MTLELNIPPEEQAVLAYWLERAKENKRDLSDEILALMRRESRIQSREYWDERLARHREKVREKYGNFSDSTALIRQDRDA